MKKALGLSFLLASLIFNSSLAQDEGPVIPGKIVLNGELDQLHEFSTLVTVPIEMPDGIKLMTDIFLPMTQDCMSLTLTAEQINEATFVGLGDALVGSNESVRIELIPRGAQLFVYNQIWDPDSNKMVDNPDKYSLPMILTRTPYDKWGDETGRIISIFGYAYAMQDMRGRYSSEGVYFPMYSDSWNKNPYHSHFKHILDYTDMDDPKNGNRHEDGYNTVQFLTKQIEEEPNLSKSLNNWTLIDLIKQKDPNSYLIGLLSDKNKDGIPDTFNICNGSLGMFGASALGNTQYQAAAAHKIDPYGSGLKGLMPIVATNEHYKYTGYQNGVFRERIVTGWIKGQIFDVEDQEDLPSFDFDPQNNIHTADDYDLPKVLTINNKTRMYFPDKFDASILAIDHFVRMRYPDENGNLSYPGYYPNSGGRGDMDASFSTVNIHGESVSPGSYDADGRVVDDPNGILGFGNSRLPDLNYNRYRNKDVPTYHLTGWWDIFTDGQIETWRLMRENVTETNPNLQKLVIGPWAHQTIGGTKTGDLQYPENATNILGFDIGDVDIEDLDVEKILQSEIVSWFRYTLNYNGYKNIGLPSVVLPQGRKQKFPFELLTIKDTLTLTIPSVSYEVDFIEFINYINGSGDLKGLPIRIEISQSTKDLIDLFAALDTSLDLGILDSTTVDMLFDLPKLASELIPELSGEEISAAVDSVNFMDVANVRFYVVGPVEDGVNDSTVGNYWFMADTFPITDNIHWQKLYMHKDGRLDHLAPVEDEGFSIYVHDPDDPIASIGGANMIVSLPDGHRNKAENNDDSHGQIELTDPKWKHTTMDRNGVIGFEMERLHEPLTVIGFPRATLYAKTNPGGVVDGPTDTDFFVRIIDVYPDGREYFVVEGCVNARAREYARYIADTHGLEDINIPFTNINIGELYEYHFRLMPIAYTWGKGHKIKILISSSNHTRYQVNPNLPLEDGDFFRRVPLDGQTYIFNGEEMEPRIAIQRLAHSDIYPSNVELPFYEKTYTVIKEQEQLNVDLDAFVYPNPAVNQLNVYMSQPDEYRLVVNNSIGQQIFKADFSDYITLDVAKMDKGLYILEIMDRKATRRITKKVTIM